MPLVNLQASKLEVKVQIRVGQALPQVWCDRTMLEQVLLNLMRNGIEAMSDAPTSQRRLTIKLGQVDNQMEIRVIDRGPGVPPELVEKLFTPLFSTKADGMGMGLNICRSIAELHHGRLGFETKPGDGTVFVLSLPMEPS